VTIYLVEPTIGTRGTSPTSPYCDKYFIYALIGDEKKLPEKHRTIWLHADGVWRGSTFSGDAPDEKPTGYFDIKEEAEAVLRNLKE
jgi:hypothetical protein